MAPADPAFTLLPLILGVLLLIAGLVLLKRGHWPRRVGVVPHCPKCDYILADLATTPRCPECGAAVSDTSSVRGERNRRPALAIAGTLLTLAGLAFLGLVIAGALGTIDWNRHKPVSWLIRDLDHPPTECASWEEIKRRMNASLLSEHDLGLLTEFALKLQQTPAQHEYDPTLFRLLGQRYVEHKLTPPQEERFFDGALRVRLEARSIVGTDDPLPYCVWCVGRGPFGWWTRTRFVQWQLDDGPTHRDQVCSGSSGMFSGRAIGGSLPGPNPLGKHRLRVWVELATNSSIGQATDDGPFDKTVIRKTETDIEVVTGHAPITTVTTPSADAVARLLTAQLEFNGDHYLYLHVGVKSPPVNLAFDVSVRAGGEEFSIGTMKLTQGVSVAGDSINVDRKDLPNPLPAQADVILRSSESAARDTTNMTQIWQGQIVFPNVPIREPITRPASTINP